MNESEILFEQIPVGSYKNFSYLLADKTTSRAVIFDPAWEIESLCSRLRNKNLQLEYIINTHAHFDHIQGNPEMKERTGAKVIMHESSSSHEGHGQLVITPSFQLEIELHSNSSTRPDILQKACASR